MQVGHGHWQEYGFGHWPLKKYIFINILLSINLQLTIFTKRQRGHANWGAVPLLEAARGGPPGPLEGPGRKRQLEGETNMDVAAALLEDRRTLPLDHVQKIVTTEVKLGEVLKTPVEAIFEQVGLE